MSNLVAEKRRDRNGRLVTRHVRAGEPAPGPRLQVPAPRVPAQATPAHRWPFKLSPQQAERVEHVLMLSGITPSEDIIGRSAWVEATRGYTTYRFDASEAEAYEVISAVARPIDAVPLLMEGITTADEALAHLDARGLSGLTANRIEFAEACLQRRVPADDAIFACSKDDALLRDGDQRGAADAIAFGLTPLGARMAKDPDGRLVMEDLAAGWFPSTTSRPWG